MREYIKEVGKHSSVYIISNILTQAIGFFLLPLLTAYLTTDEYGIVGIVMQIISFFTVFYSLGMRNSWARFFFDFEDRSDGQKQLFGNLLSILMLFGFLVSVLLSFFGKGLFERIAPGVSFYPYILIGIWGAYFSVFYQLKLNMFRIRQQSLYYGMYSVGKFIAVISSTVILVVVFKKGALGRIASEFWVVFSFAILSIILLWKDVKFNINFKKSWPSIKYGINILPHAILGVLMPLADKLIINHYYDLETTGIYNIAFQFGTIMMMVVFSINTAWSPFFMKTATAKGDDAKPIFSRLTTYYMAAILFLALGLSLFSKEMVSLMTARDYHEAYKAVPVFVFKYVFAGMYFMSIVPLYYVKRAVKYIPLITYSAGIINLGLNFLLIPKFGIFGAAWASFAYNFVNFTLTQFAAQKFYKIKYEVRRILILFLLTGLVIGAFYALSVFSFSFWQGILIKIGLLSCYFGSLYLFKFLTASEIENLKDIYQKVIKRYWPSK